MLDVITLLALLGLFIYLRIERSKFVTEGDLSATVESVRETVQTVADKVDVDFDLNDHRFKTQESSLISLSASLVRLADVAGFEQKDGLWVKKTAVKPVAKKETPVAKKATAKKGSK